MASPSLSRLSRALPLSRSLGSSLSSSLGSSLVAQSPSMSTSALRSALPRAPAGLASISDLLPSSPPLPAAPRQAGRCHLLRKSGRRSTLAAVHGSLGEPRFYSSSSPARAKPSDKPADWGPLNVDLDEIDETVVDETDYGFGGEDWVPPPKLDETLMSFKSKMYGRLALPPYVHPNEFKVRMEVKTKDLGLSKEELETVKMIVGPRYDTTKGVIVMVSRKFDSRLDNKRYLVNVLETVVDEARKMNA